MRKKLGWDRFLPLSKLKIFTLNGTIVLAAGDIKEVWEITSGGVSILPIDDFFVISFYAMSEQLISEDAGNYYIDRPEENPDEATKNQEVIIQIQYRLYSYEVENLIGSIFKEETDEYNEITGNWNNIYIYTHEELWNSSIEFLAKNEDDYHLVVRAESDILRLNFKNGEDTKVEIDCWTNLLPEKAGYW